MTFKRDLGMKEEREECKDSKEWLMGHFNDIRL